MARSVGVVHRSMARTFTLLAVLCLIAGATIGPAWADPAAKPATDAEREPIAESPTMEGPPKVGQAASSRGSASRADILAIIEGEARRAGVPAAIAEAVTHTESGFNPGVIGADGEIGLMQVMPPTARMMGFSGTLAELAVPETNIRYGVTYLAQAWRLAGGDLCTAVMKYRAGHGESRFSYLSVDYCLKVRARLAAKGFPIVGIVPVASFGNPVGRCRNKCLAGSRGGPNLAALNSKLSQIAFRVTVLKMPMR